MLIPTSVDIDINKRTGSKRPHHNNKQLITLCAITAGILLPLSSFAASLDYLTQNTPDFIQKITHDYGEMVNIAALLQDYDPKMILAVIVVESEGNEVATSNKGAQGLMQLMPATAKAMGAKDPKEPFQNILAGTKYLKELERTYGFNSPQEALVAYNMGPSRARRWLSQYGPEDYGYVQKVMYVYNVLAVNERNGQRLADAVKDRVSAEEVGSGSVRPLLTKPRNLSLAQLPLTLPVSRRTVATESGK